jgi:mRNA-degrading endonuclease RelE of RelBE toxin-antitoxin system
VRYRLEIKDEARQQLRALSQEQRQNVGRRLDMLQNNLTGDVKKLAGRTQNTACASAVSEFSLCWNPI